MSQTSDNNKRIAKNTLLLYLRMLFMMGISLYTSRVILNTLGVEDYGIYNVVGGIVAMFGFINGSMSAATQRYITFSLGKGNKEQLQKVFSTTLQIHAIIAAILILLGEFVGLWFLYNKMQIPPERLNAAFWVLQCSIVDTAIMILSVPYNSDIVAHEKMSVFAYISILEAVLKLLIVFLLLIFSFDKLILYAILLLVVQIMIRFCYSFYCNRNFDETRYRQVWDKQLFKEMTGFASWNLFGNLAAALFGQGLNLLLNIFFGPLVNAARGIAVQVQMAVAQFSLNFQTAINPQITKNYATGNLKEMHKLIYRSTKFTFYVLLLIVFPLFMEAEFVLKIWLKNIPQWTVIFVKFSLFLVILDALVNPLMISASATGKIKFYQTVIGSILLSIVPISYIILKFGAPPYFVYIVQLIVYLIAFSVRLQILKGLIKISIANYIKYALFPCIKVFIGGTSLPLVAFMLWFSSNSFLNFVYFCIISFISILIFSYLLGMNINERKYVFDKFLKKIKL